jgi:hypothetical protein
MRREKRRENTFGGGENVGHVVPKVEDFGIFVFDHGDYVLKKSEFAILGFCVGELKSVGKKWGGKN